jgi:hypothetical protein
MNDFDTIPSCPADWTFICPFIRFAVAVAVSGKNILEKLANYVSALYNSLNESGTFAEWRIRWKP